MTTGVRVPLGDSMAKPEPSAPRRNTPAASASREDPAALSTERRCTPHDNTGRRRHGGSFDRDGAPTNALVVEDARKNALGGLA